MNYIRGTNLNDSLTASAEFGSAIHGLGGLDTLTGSELSDYLEGDAGSDLLIALWGDDVLSGGTGNDTLIAGEGHDSLNGGAGNDVLDGGLGADIFKGELGVDKLYLGNDTNKDIIMFDLVKQAADRIYQFHVHEDLLLLSRDPSVPEFDVRIVKAMVDFDGDGTKELVSALQFKDYGVAKPVWTNLALFEPGVDPTMDDVWIS